MGHKKSPAKYSCKGKASTCIGDPGTCVPMIEGDINAACGAEPSEGRDACAPTANARADIGASAQY